MEISGELEEKFDTLVSSVSSMRFERPAVVRDEAKVIIEEINELKS